MTIEQIEQAAQDHAKSVLGDKYNLLQGAAEAIALDFMAGFNLARKTYEHSSTDWENPDEVCKSLARM